MRAQPGWAMLEAIAPTLAYDDEVLAGGRVPRDLTSTIAVPALVIAGGGQPSGLQQAAKATADALPDGGAPDARRPDARRGPGRARTRVGRVLRRLTGTSTADTS